MSKYRKQNYNDLGLGSKATEGNFRSLNKDGSFNVRKINIPFFERINFFHLLVSMSWKRFFGVIFLSYLCINMIFATIYYSIGMDQITGIEGDTEAHKFMEAFFFSSQTITTLGYGRVAPVGFIANLAASFESLLGLLSFALATGLLYGRFSNPSAKLKYSYHALISPYQDITAYMFRVINVQSNQLMEVEVTLTLSIKRRNSESREFHQLELERSKVIFMPSTWTIVHPITESSPLFDIDEKEMLERDAEFISIFRAFDEASSQIVYSRTSYKAAEIKWGKKFAYILHQENGKQILDVSRIDELEHTNTLQNEMARS
ncbi:MAG: ion channel [Flavobacteriales bacterium]